MCDLGTCAVRASHYVVTRGAGATQTYRTELCRTCLNLAHRVSEANLTMIVEYGRLDRAWSVHPGGKP